MLKGVWLVITALVLGGCRIVSQQELAELKNPPNPLMTNIAQIWQQKIVPQIAAEAIPLSELRRQLQSAEDFATACKTLGYRRQQEAPCVFTVSVTGIVEKLSTASRSGKMTLRDQRGEQVIVRIGPVIHGTALRDALRDVSYQDFNDQALFGEFGRGINNQASAMTGALKPVVGDRLTVKGVFSSWELPDSVPEITPAQVTRQ